jgi:DNA-directed RNA polymerase subunit L
MAEQIRNKKINYILLEDNPEQYEENEDQVAPGQQSTLSLATNSTVTFLKSLRSTISQINRDSFEIYTCEHPVPSILDIDGSTVYKMLPTDLQACDTVSRAVVETVAHATEYISRTISPSEREAIADATMSITPSDMRRGFFSRFYHNQIAGYYTRHALALKTKRDALTTATKQASDFLDTEELDHRNACTKRVIEAATKYTFDSVDQSICISCEKMNTPEDTSFPRFDFTTPTVLAEPLDEESRIIAFLTLFAPTNRWLLVAPKIVITCPIPVPPPMIETTPSPFCNCDHPTRHGPITAVRHKALNQLLEAQRDRESLLKAWKESKIKVTNLLRQATRQGIPPHIITQNFVRQCAAKDVPDNVQLLVSECLSQDLVAYPPLKSLN